MHSRLPYLLATRKPPADVPDPTPTTKDQIPPGRRLLWFTLLAAAGVAATGGTAAYAVSESAFVMRAVHVQGKVVHVTEDHTPKGSRLYKPVFTYTDAAGEAHTVDADMDDGHVYRAGQRVPVIYDPRAPAVAQIDSLMMKWSMLVYVGPVGLAMLYFGVPGARKAWFARRAQRDEDRPPRDPSILSGP